MSQLFRKEAVAHATRRLDGQVVLATPLSVRTLGLLLAAIVFGATIFAALGTYSRKANVAGYLIPDQGMIRAAAPASATLQSLIVKEGDVISAGDRIAVLSMSTEISTGNVGDVISLGLTSETAAARTKAESRLAQLEVEREQAKIRLSKSEAEHKQITIQVGLQGQRLQIARAEYERGVEIASKGFLARREVDSRRLALLSAEQELAAHHRQLASVESAIADIKARLASIPLEIDAARSEASTAQASLQQRRAEAEARRLQFVLAPVSGRIAALPVTAGQPIATGGTIAVIVPVGGKLEAELLAPSRAIGFVQPGQDVAISLQAFPYQRFGTIHGTIRTVSSTVISPAEVGFQGLRVEEPVFRIRVSLANETMMAYGQAIPLQPGMLASAEIVFDRRSLLRWLLDPIYAVGRRS
ncbi:MAG: HlyD family efflux transporter periplasmic adaptor subunit [Hyphomicrobiaceae bacterium]